MKIDFTSKDFDFISNHGEYYIEGKVICTADYTDWTELKNIEDGWGMFEGLTMVRFKGYDGELPRMDEDTASFSEFSIYDRGELINEWSYKYLGSKIKADNRVDKIDEII